MINEVWDTRLRWKLISGAFFRGFGQLEVEFAGEADARTAIAAGEAVTLVVDHLAQFGQLLGGGVLHCQFGDRPLYQAPGQEHLACFFHAWARHHRATIGPAATPRLHGPGATARGE